MSGLVRLFSGMKQGYRAAHNDQQQITAPRYGTGKPSRTSESRAIRRGAGRMRINSPATATAVPSAKILQHYYCS